MSQQWTLVQDGYVFQANVQAGMVTVETSHNGIPYSISHLQTNAPDKFIAKQLAIDIVENIATRKTGR